MECTCKAEVLSASFPDQYRLMMSPIELKNVTGLNEEPRRLISIPAVVSEGSDFLEVVELPIKLSSPDVKISSCKNLKC